jgi:poly-gamma-glutamate synthesis protein (capsule biosynthesis protein)
MTLRLALGGDVMTGRGIDQILRRPVDPALHEPWITSALDYVRLAEEASGEIPRGVAPDYIWGDALGALAARAPELRIVNLETAVTTSEAHAPKGINYRMHPANIGVLTAAGIDAVTLANNHVLDWGEAGLLETLETLEAAGVPFACAGRTAAEAAEPVALAAGPGRVLLFGIGAPSSGIPPGWEAGPGPGVNLHLDHDRTVRGIARAAAALRRPGDRVVVSIHWGANWGYEVPDRQRRLAWDLIDEAGADVVHGHSSHHPKAVALHSGRPILYGCGDLINDYEGIGGRGEYRGELSLIYLPELGADGALAALAMLPFRVRRFRLEAAGPEDRAWLAARMDRECARFGARVEEAGGALRLAWPA